MEARIPAKNNGCRTEKYISGEAAGVLFAAAGTDAALECAAGSLRDMTGERRGEGGAPAEDSEHRCHLALTQEESET